MANNTPIETDFEAAFDFLRGLQAGGPWHIVTMPPDGKLRATTAFMEDEEALRSTLEEAQHENVYFHVNGLNPSLKHRKAKKEDVRSIIALHVDVDNLEALESIRAFHPHPSVITCSGGGFQAFWKLEQASFDLERAERINAHIATILGGDNCHNIDRIMRLPGTTNWPNKRKREHGRVPKGAYVVEADWSRTYSLDDFPEPENNDPAPAGPKGAIASLTAEAITVVEVEGLPSGLSNSTQALIQQGDDPENPVGNPGARYRSRSEVVFRVACDLARANLPESLIAGVLINPRFGISRSILEKRNPQRYALKQARAAIAAISNDWPDPGRDGRPRPSMRNAYVALQRLGLSFGFDKFKHRKVLNGTAMPELNGELSDDAVAMLRGVIIEGFNFDPKAENVRDAVNQLCLENPFHPIRAMLKELEWDGVKRLDHWLARYLGAQDTALNREIGRITLIAAVRRVRNPGVKFDQIPIFEGQQGSGKSTSLRVLAGEEYHSDQEILTQDARTQMELLEGIWIYELGEVEGFNRAEVNKIKAFASRQEDRSRMAYGRFVESRPRQAIFIGTTNENTYLRDQTGNRRFWPIRTGTIDLDGLRRDRDQLWAEAAEREARGESISLPPELWEDAAREQAGRLEEDPWIDKLANLRGKAYGDVVRLETQHILTDVLSVELRQQTQAHSKRLATLMRKLGWEPKKFRLGTNVVRGYERAKPDDHQDDATF